MRTYLLVPNSGVTSSNAVTVAGRVWALRSFEDGEALPPYAAISYAWGDGRTEHPFAEGATVSDRVVAVLDAAVRVARTTALWLDAWCVPVAEPERASTLRSLGALYSNASEVLVVLSADARPLFDELERGEPVTLRALEALEQEAWTRRFWTYQELALSRELRFVVEGGAPFTLDAMAFLNKVGEPLSRATKEELAALAAVDNLNDTLASWIHTGSAPFAYQVMAAAALRGAERPADRFNAVLGAIDPTGIHAGSTNLGEAAEQFMATCESKGDLSFIYSTAPRSHLPGRSWRPEPRELLPVLAWHTFGKGQGGAVLEHHAVLHDLALVPRGTLAASTRASIEAWLVASSTERGTDPLSSSVARTLLRMGSAELGAPLELEAGYFFPITTRDCAGHEVFVASEVRWVHGAPGLLVDTLSPKRRRCVGVGIFVGLVPGGVSVEIE